MSIERYNFGLTAPEIDKALQETHHILQRMTEFEQQSAECAENSQMAQTASDKAVALAAQAVDAGRAAAASAAEAVVAAANSQQYATQMKLMMGVEEVGDVAEKDYVEGTLVWHNDVLYILNQRWYRGQSFEYAVAEETSISDEFNKIKGTQVETVIVEITPVTAIPEDGVPVRIYNQISQTYTEDVIFTPSDNHHKIADIPFGDVYDIILPTIEGYVKPADQTFRASQFVRSRDIEYKEGSVVGYESLVLNVTKSNGERVETSYVTINLLNEHGDVSSSITVDIGGGVSEAVNIPWGTKYIISWPDLAGMLPPDNLTLVSRNTHRNVTARYVSVITSPIKWVTADWEYLEPDTDISALLDQNKIIGVAFLDSDLIVHENSQFVYLFGQSKISGYWTNPVVDSPSSNSQYNGISNTSNAIDAILNCGYEVDSVFLTAMNAHSGIFDQEGTEIPFFIASYKQDMAMREHYNEINNYLAYYGSTLSLSPGGTYSSQNNKEQCYYYYVPTAPYATTKKNKIMGFRMILPVVNVTLN